MRESLTHLQRSIVEAPLQGEIVVGGVAGSGKTTAAIYRAAYLCDHTPRHARESTVLFLCFNRTLESAIQQRVATFPPRVYSRISVRTVHSWCWPYVQRQLPGFTVLEGDREQLGILREAIQATRYIYGNIEVFERNTQLFLDELRLIKGCGLHDLDEYLCQRIARTGDLSPEDYTAIYAVAQQYDRLLRERCKLDYDDYALLALAAIQSTRTMSRCDHVIVDEAQDLSDRQIALARSIARQSLLLIADQAQMIYRVTRLPDSLPAPEHYDVVLSESLRTTAAIFAHARRLLPEGDQSVLPERDGPPPVYLSFRWSDEEAVAVTKLVSQLLADGVGAEAIGVLARRRDMLDPVATALHALGIAAVVEHGDTQAPGVRLTTIHAAKGREFDAVILIGLVEGVLPSIRPEMDRVAVSQELAMARRQLYVAMTRARCQLWLTSSEGRPSRLLDEIGLIERAPVRP
ncbi:MAG: ATP-dependent helicase [Chloroflexales bacterium]